MVSFLLAFVRFLRVLLLLLSDKEIRGGLILLGIALLLGTAFYHNVEGWSLIDSLYFCVVTLATIGFGDLTPHTTFGKLFTILYVFVGMGLFVGVLNVIATRNFPKRDT